MSESFRERSVSKTSLRTLPAIVSVCSRTHAPHAPPPYAMAAPATKKISKFSVLKAATPQGAKRSVNEIAVKGAAPEIPKASKVILTDTARPTQTPRRLPASAPVRVCLFKVTDWAWPIVAVFSMGGAWRVALSATRYSLLNPSTG